MSESRAAVTLLAVAVSMLASCAPVTPAPSPSPLRSASPPPGATAPPETSGEQVVLVAGDVASCSSSGDEATAALLAANAGLVVIPGDIAYESGSTAEFERCFEPSWGPHKARMRPAPGNHEYQTADAGGYFEYFGAAAGDPGEGYYAFDVGSWRVYSLNSNCGAIGGCDAGSPQVDWLRADLEANPRTCVAAFWHHPRFSSGRHGSSPATVALWQALQDFGAELILAAHDHDYERFAPQTAAGDADTDRGVRQFVVGTGGRSHYPFRGDFLANSEAHNDDAFGILKLALGAGSYAWQFLPVEGATYSDSGSSTCH